MHRIQGWMILPITSSEEFALDVTQGPSASELYRQAVSSMLENSHGSVSMLQLQRLLYEYVLLQEAVAGLCTDLADIHERMQLAKITLEGGRR